jgi:hypothetical protein
MIPATGTGALLIFGRGQRGIGFHWTGYWRIGFHWAG